MTEPAKAQTIDTEIVRHCAFSLPAVTLTLGRKNWPCLRDTYELLIADMQVRCYMLHIILHSLFIHGTCIYLPLIWDKLLVLPLTLAK